MPANVMIPRRTPGSDAAFLGQSGVPSRLLPTRPRRSVHDPEPQHADEPFGHPARRPPGTADDIDTMRRAADANSHLMRSIAFGARRLN